VDAGSGAKDTIGDDTGEAAVSAGGVATLAVAVESLIEVVVDSAKAEDGDDDDDDDEPDESKLEEEDVPMCAPTSHHLSSWQPRCVLLA
jgi:hypothetical protein